MSTNRLLCAGVLCGLVGASTGALATFALHPQTASAAAGVAKQNAVRWEYCALVRVGSVKAENGGITHVATVCYYTARGTRCENVEADADGVAFASALSKLGSEGWEMVSSDEFHEVSDSKDPRISSSFGPMYCKRVG